MLVPEMAAVQLLNLEVVYCSHRLLVQQELPHSEHCGTPPLTLTHLQMFFISNVISIETILKSATELNKDVDLEGVADMPTGSNTRDVLISEI